MNKFLPALLLALALLPAFPAAAQQKIATLDLKKIFDEFYKTKLADALIRDEAAGITKDLKAVDDQRQKLVGEYKNAVEEAQNQAISVEEREKRKKVSEEKLIQINALEQQFKSMQRSADSTLGEKQARAREKILKEIQAVVAARAKAGGYTMVLDTAGEGLSRTPVVFYTTGQDDLTAAIIKELNTNAPADLPKADPPAGKENGAKEEKK